MTNLYYSPAEAGLENVGDHDTAGSYEFDQIVVLRRPSDGALFAAHDSGCSCPTPFEGATDLERDWTRLASVDDLDALAAEHWAGSYRGSDYAGDRNWQALRGRVRDLLAGAAS